MAFFSFLFLTSTMAKQYMYSWENGLFDPLFVDIKTIVDTTLV